jgi:hypothetical protein
MAYSFEIGTIKPSSESNSLLIRATRNSPLSKCKYNRSYKDKPFEIRTVLDIERDIAVAKVMRDKIMEITLKAGSSGGMQKVVSMMLKDPPNESFRNVALWLLGGGENAFIQDDNPLMMKTVELGQVIVYLRNTFPKIKKVTCYSQAKTTSKKKPVELIQLRQAGLTCLNIGLDSGFDPVLKFMAKGETAEDLIKGGRRVVESGISLSNYVILGLGGKDLSSLHARATAEVLNNINPEYIRIRTLIINNNLPLNLDVVTGKFIRATDEEIIREEQEFIDKLRVTSRLSCNHISNLLPELDGKLPEDRPKIFNILDTFNSLSSRDKINFMVGRRVGIYKYLNDINESQRYELVEQIKFKLTRGEIKFDPHIIFSLMEEFN